MRKFNRYLGYTVAQINNYDFHTLTQDIIGQVYEQFLAHNLKQEGNHILIRTDQTLRQREGAYYTPSYVVRYLVEGTLGRLGMQVLEEARNHLQQKCYRDAQATINRLKAIKVLDLACGSGSFLIAAYDAFVTMYHLWNELLEGVMAFPHCPNPSPRNAQKYCGFCDLAATPFVPGEIRRCKQCGQTYTEQDVREWSYLGINYKSPALYQGEKLLVRKTGRGIYATLDRTGAYTNQVVYIFKLRASLPEQYAPLRLSYMLGVLNSRMMLYRYYKALGDIEWKSFPYMTQKTIMQLPIRRIDFMDSRQTYFHNQIADRVDAVIASNRPPTPEADAEIERLVRDLYGVNTPLAYARIEAELERISRFGSLLGSSAEDSESEDEE